MQIQIVQLTRNEAPADFAAPSTRSLLLLPNLIVECRQGCVIFGNAWCLAFVRLGAHARPTRRSIIVDSKSVSEFAIGCYKPTTFQGI